MMTSQEFNLKCKQVQLYICLGYSMYTWERRLFPSPFTIVHTKVAPLPSHQCCYLSSLISYCIQNDVTSQCLSRNVRFKKPRPLLLPGIQVSGIWILIWMVTVQGRVIFFLRNTNVAFCVLVLRCTSLSIFQCKNPGLRFTTIELYLLTFKLEKFYICESQLWFKHWFKKKSWYYFFVLRWNIFLGAEE